MARRTQEQAQQTRKDILAGALAVFSEKGFSRTNLTDIAKKIGMTRGAIYWHFKNKQDLLIELMNAMHEYEQTRLAKMIPEAQGLGSLKDHFMARVQLLTIDEKFMKFATFMSMQVEWATEKRVSDLVRNGHLRTSPFAQVRPHLIKARDMGEIREDIDLELIEDILIGQFIGAVRMAMGGMTRRPLEAILEAALNAVFDSIRA